MTRPNRCETCGALDGVPWSRGHAPHCPSYQPPASARLCPVCSYPAAVTYVRMSEPGYGVPGRGHPAEVEFRCRRCPDVSWVETSAADLEDGGSS